MSEAAGLRQIAVVGAVVVRDGKVLAAQRGGNGPLAGLWEFPGGKIEPSESAREALEREVAEELNCVVEVGGEITTTVHAYDFAEITLTTFFCALVDGEPTLTEHTAVRWLLPRDLDSLEWAPADVPTVALVKATIA
ncbi:(deoxy)nucleoside triphosphate pyrophosphohydrolase [Alloalcanivorax gelatiniphagus]